MYIHMTPADECPECEGTGQVTNPDWSDSLQFHQLVAGWPQTPENITCPACGGTGQATDTDEDIEF